MARCADLWIRRSDGSPIVAVEVKNARDLSRDVAIALRQGLLMGCGGTTAPFFLLVSQDVGFLWTEANEKGLDSPPSYEFPMHKLLPRYLPDWKASDRFGRELEFLIFQWLSDLSDDRFPTDEEPEKSLQESGFLKAIRGARVSFELPA